MNDLVKTIQYIVSRSSELKNKYTEEKKAEIGFGCIFCQNEEEYLDFTDQISSIAKVVEKTTSGFTYLLDIPIDTASGALRLVKIRKPDPARKERGDADFNTDYEKLKGKYQSNPRFELIKRNNFEMLRLSDPNFDVLVCFSNIPLSKSLGIELKTSFV